MKFDVSHVITLVFFAGSVIALYWKGRNHTDAKLAVHEERFCKINNEIEDIAETRSRLDRLEAQLTSLCRTINDLKVLVEKYGNAEVRFVKIEQQLTFVQASIENLYTSLEGLKREIECIRDERKTSPRKKRSPR